MAISKTLANFETSLAAKMSDSASSFTLNQSTDDDGTTLAGTYGLTIDEGTSSEEHVIATLAGAAATVVTRGLSRVDGTTNKSANQKEHARGAVVKMTNHPALIQMVDLLNGDVAFDTVDWDGVQSITGLSTPGAGETTKASNVEYVNNVSIAGASDATTVGKGIVEIATDAELAAGTATGGTGATVTAGGSSFNETAAAGKVPVAESTGKLGEDWLGLASAGDIPYSDGTDIQAASAGTAGDMIYSDASDIQVLNLGTAGQVLTVNSGATAPEWSSVAEFGGDGSDGALDTSGGTVDIDCGAAAYVEKNYTSINVATNNLTFSNPHANGTVVVLRSQGNATISATIDVSGMGAAAGTGGAGALNQSTGNTNDGTAGTDSGWILDDAGHAAPKGNRDAGGGGGASSAATIWENTFFYTDSTNKLFKRVLHIACGSGGAGGGSGTSDNGGTSGGGGAGGRGGGGILLECAGAWNFTGTITVAGDAGTVGEAGNDNGSGTAGGGGGGGGGSAGMIVALYDSLTSDAGTYTVDGGDGGNGGAGDYTAGGGMGSGGGGAGGSNHNTASGGGGSGASGGAAGNPGTTPSGGGTGGSGGNYSGAAAGGGGGGGGSLGTAISAENLYFA